MPTNRKKYIKEYMKNYSSTDKYKKYQMNYYNKNKERLQKLQREYYHKNKNDPTKSHYLEKRLLLQKKYYHSKLSNTIHYKKSVNQKAKEEAQKAGRKKSKHYLSIRIHYGSFVIKFK